jgi:hypothetical protein
LYATTKANDRSSRWVLLLLAGAAVALTLGLYGRVHEPAAQRSTAMLLWTIDFSTAQAMLQFKSWLTTLAIVFALLQLVTGLRLRDRIAFPRTVPLWYADIHRLSGTLALLCTVPVAYHCLWSLGFQTSMSNPRAAAHSFLGCFFYGAFVTKILAVRSDRVPDWLVPVMGGLVLTSLCGVWLTSALYFFTGRIG